MRGKVRKTLNKDRLRENIMIFRGVKLFDFFKMENMYKNQEDQSETK
jgi:hypothetical protein